jgi:hypothetical protein
MRKFITEEMGIHNEWYDEAKGVTLDSLSAFISKLTNDYSHDLNTFPHALVAGMLATAAAINAGPEGGISQAQAHKVLGLFIRKWSKMEGPLKLTSWYGLLHPANEPQFTTVPDEVAKALVEQAKGLLAGDLTGTEPNVVEHLKKIAAGEIPFGYKVAKHVK